MNPIRLVVDETSAGVTVRVVGASDRDFVGTFTLQMSGNGNRSTQRGSATLTAGESAILSNVTLAGVSHWEASLEVTPEEGAPYEERASGPA